MNVQTYLYFSGGAERALQLYQRALGASVEFIMRNRDRGVSPPDEVFHATLRIGETLLSLSDDPAHAPQGFSLLVHLDSAADADKAFGALAVDGIVVMPLQGTLWSSYYGIVRDSFGVTWKLQV